MLNLPEDTKLAAAVEGRRRREAERKCRIFNRRNLVIGVDRDALDRQVIERGRRDEAERQLDRAFEEQRLQDARYGLLVEDAIEQERRALDKDVNTFRAVYQRREHRRDYDLYDPDGLKKALPARLRDDDPRCGISSAQKFQGEDVTSRERTKHLNETITSWLGQQVEERRAAEREMKEAQLAYDESLIARDCRAVELEMLEQDVKRRVDDATSRFNLALAQEAQSRRQLDKNRRREEDKAEIYNAVTGDLLTENPEVHRSAYGSNRVIGFMYKGMTEDERLDVRRYQQAQIEEKRLERERQASLDAAFAHQITTAAKHNLLCDADMAQRQRQVDQQIAEQNKRLYVQHEADKRHLEKVVYTNRPTAAYFEQFNSSTR